MIALLQFLGVLWTAYATGPVLIIALAVALAAIYAQVTVNDLVIARYTADAWRGRVYRGALFPVLPGVGRRGRDDRLLHGRGGFDLVLGTTAVVALGFVLAHRRDRGAGQRRREGAHARGGAGGVGRPQPFPAVLRSDLKRIIWTRHLRNLFPLPTLISMAMLQPKGAVVSATTIKLVTPDVRAPSRSWSLGILGLRLPRHLRLLRHACSVKSP